MRWGYYVISINRMTSGVPGTCIQTYINRNENYFMIVIPRFGIYFQFWYTGDVLSPLNHLRPRQNEGSCSL